MKYNPDHTIDEYTLGYMTAEEIIHFENEMKHTPGLHDKVTFNRELISALLEKDIISLRASVKNIMEHEQYSGVHNVEQIDNYLLDNLSEEDRSEYEKRWKLEENLRSETELNREINDAITEKDVIRLRNLTKELSNSKQYRSRYFLSPSVNRKPLIYFSAAASFAALIAAGAYSLMKPQKTVEELYSQIYEPYTAAIGYSRSLNNFNPAMAGIEYYNEHRYDAALQQFSQVLSENEYHAMSNFYSGLCLLEKKEYNQAGLFFQKVIDDKNNLFLEQAEWYLALSYMAGGEEGKTQEILNVIIAKNGYYSPNAREVLKKISFRQQSRLKQHN